MKETSRRTAMIVFNEYPADPRVRREAEALAATGMTIDVICLASDGSPSLETVNNVNVVRLPLRKRRSWKLCYLYEYGVFMMFAFITVNWLHMLHRYQIVHVHNMPDILVFCAIIPRLTGAKIILDLHDPTPEVYMTKYSIGQDHLVIKILRFLEKDSIRIADLVLTPNIAFRDLFVSRSCSADKIHIVMNSPQENIFNMDSPDCSIETNGTFTMMFHGVINQRSGLEKALEAISQIRNLVPQLRFEIYGAGDSLERVLRQIDELNLGDVVHYHGLKSLEQIAEAIRTINIGIIPNIMSPFTNLNLPTRILEYLSMEKPVIAPKTKGILDYFDTDSLFFFEAGDVASLSDVILEAYHNPHRRQEIVRNGTKVYVNHQWKLQRELFVNRVSCLM